MAYLTGFWLASLGWLWTNAISDCGANFMPRLVLALWVIASVQLWSLQVRPLFIIHEYVAFLLIQ
jgi:hypothetical protein